MRRGRTWRIALLLLAASLRPAALQAQEPTAVLWGFITDQSGSVLPGATVQATRPDRTAVVAVVSDKAGRYQFVGLPAGEYSLTFSLMSFAEVRRRSIALPAKTTRVDVTMQVAMSASVVVTARDTFRNLADLAHPEESLVGLASAASEGAVTATQIAARPIMRSGEVLEAVPGVIISQHSGEGKANQYYLRGFNLDHGTDFATIVAGLPVNLPSHAHGQGYSDLNFLIPELVTGVQFKKGPYSAVESDFSAAGSATVNYANQLDRSIASASVGQDGWSRLLVAASPRIGRGTLLAAMEFNHNDGPWLQPDNFRKVNGVIRYSRGDAQNGFSLTGLAYDSQWNSTDQVPDRAVGDGRISRFGNLDPTDGGATARYAAVADYQRTDDNSLTRATAFASKYRLNLFSNFTYALDDADHGDQFEQADRRWVTGGRLSQTRLMRWGARRGENTVGLEVRNDSIPVVGLYHTENRARLSTTREDAVVQTSAGVFAANELRWFSWLRTTAGVRVDGYRFDVRSDDAANSGAKVASLVSPKAGAIIGPWQRTEFYINGGTGFHSNDARGVTLTRNPITLESADAVTPLVRAKGAEIGLRSVAIPRVQITAALWRLDLESELVFVGDAGTTEAGRPSKRYGVEVSAYGRLASWLSADADVAWSHARFRDADPAGAHIPGAAQMIASIGLSADRTRGAFGSIRLRYFGPRPLIEDNSVRSQATSLLNAQVGYHLSSNLHVVVDAFNLLNSAASDVQYFYRSRLPDEPIGGIDDIHSHPALPRSIRAVFRIRY